MRVIKFDDQEWREWLRKRLINVNGTAIDDIIQNLLDDSFSVSGYVTDKCIADTLFGMFDEDFSDYTNPNALIESLPTGFLLAVHEHMDLFSDDRITEAIKWTAWQDFHHEVNLYAVECAENNEESAPSWEEVESRSSHYSMQWLEHIVRAAIASYNSPIAVSIPSLSNYTE